VLGESLESDASEFFDSMPQAVLSLEGHAGFLVSALSAEGSAAGGCRALGAFFIGPAYPNRSSTRHVAQGLVITHPRHRGKGVGRLMARVMLALAVYMYMSIYMDIYSYVYT
jgi:GNAT superfamily N-acetyltransferase